MLHKNNWRFIIKDLGLRVPGLTLSLLYAHGISKSKTPGWECFGL